MGDVVTLMGNGTSSILRISYKKHFFSYPPLSPSPVVYSVLFAADQSNGQLHLYVYTSSR